MTCVCLLGNWHVRCKDSWEDELSFPIGEICWFFMVLYGSLEYGLTNSNRVGYLALPI